MTEPVWDITSQERVSTEDPDLGTEYGGVGGIVQPPPHTPTASERLTMIYAIDPDDDGSQPTSVVAPEQVGDFSSRGYR
jgi:hypothetical protein